LYRQNNISVFLDTTVARKTYLITQDHFNEIVKDLFRLKTGL